MQTDNTFSVLFFTRNTRKNSENLSIYARITVNGQRTEISLKRSVPVNHWDASKGRARGNTQNLKMLNNYLDQSYGQILNSQKQLLDEHKMITPQAVKARYLGEDAQHKTLMELVEYHNTTMQSVLKPGTMKNYYSTKKYLDMFLIEKRKTKDIYLKQLNYRFITDFEQYIRRYKPKKARKTCTNNGTMKHLERLMKMTNLAVKLEWLDKDPFRNYKLSYIKSERSYLTQREIDLIVNTKFRSETYERVKDIFLFSCYTGLSYVDVKELMPIQLMIGIDGNYWLHTKREKTNEVVNIPLLPKAKQIIEKYRQESEATDKLLPVLSNQKTNKYLKEIISASGIHKHITFHSARHTFATTVTLPNGVPIETVSKLLGHTKLSTTQIYARVLQKKVGEDMSLLIHHYKKREQKLSEVKQSLP
ncbi:site-specific integrase [Cellulophaga sp. F20128]|uniref:site-specific integrase n=1 Tax=Cellulophaga sp. F20128 TaxID=2926413 RepID=UPI001FF39B2B|nr:site-specific integrase [Cellulophaga sp. F20128]MCK0157666.1 site-specific integrase [Cellulophaga sp. F20128]